MEKRVFFPIFIPTDGLNILVIGAGNIAARRVNSLVQFSWNVTVIAPGIADSIRKLADSGEISLIEKAADPEDIDSFDIVLACTDNTELNSVIGDKCREKGIPFNDCSNKNNCSFFFPGLVLHDELVIGVTAEGKNHKAAKHGRDAIARALETEEKTSHE